MQLCVLRKTVTYPLPQADQNTVFLHLFLAWTSKLYSLQPIGNGMDMSPSFISGAAKHLPAVSITFDKFHVIKQLNEALDEVRRNEQKKNPLLKGSRYSWLKNPENLTATQRKTLQTLSKENTRTAKVYQMKLTFQDIYKRIYDRATVDAAVRKWLSWVVRSRLEPVNTAH